MKKTVMSILLTCMMLVCCSCRNTGAEITGTAAEETTAAAQTVTTIAVAPPEAKPEVKDQSWQQHTEPVTLSIMSEITLSQHSESGQIPGLWGEDPVSWVIMDMTGVRLNQLQDGVDATLDVLVASKETPDLYCGYVEGSNYELENSTWSYSLDELADQYCPDFWNQVDALEKLNNTAEDGKVYTLRSNYVDEATYADPLAPVMPAYIMTVNTDVLAELDADMPETVEELEKLLYQAYEVRDGKKIKPYRVTEVTDSPLAGWMGIQREVYWDYAQKCVKSPLRQSEWVDFLKTMNRWYRDDILALPKVQATGDVLTDWLAKNDWMTATHKQGFVTANTMESASYTAVINEGTEAVNDGFPYQVITRPLPYQGEVANTAEDSGAWRLQGFEEYGYQGTGLFILRYCNQPDRAIWFYQFLKSDEGAKLTHWGIAGTHYTLNENGLPVYLEEYRYSSDKASIGDLSVNYREQGLNYWTFVGNSRIEALTAAAGDQYSDNWDSQQMRSQIAELGLNYKEYAWQNKMPVLQFALPDAQSDEGIQYDKINAVWKKTVEEIVTKSQDAAEVEDRWASLMRELETLGLDEIEKGMNERFAQNLKRYQDAGYYTNMG